MVLQVSESSRGTGLWNSVEELLAAMLLQRSLVRHCFCYQPFYVTSACAKALHAVIVILTSNHFGQGRHVKRAVCAGVARKHQDSDASWGHMASPAIRISSRSPPMFLRTDGTGIRQNSEMQDLRKLCFAVPQGHCNLHTVTLYGYVAT